MPLATSGHIFAFPQQDLFGIIMGNGELLEEVIYQVLSSLDANTSWFSEVQTAPGGEWTHSVHLAPLFL